MELAAKDVETAEWKKCCGMLAHRLRAAQPLLTQCELDDVALVEYDRLLTEYYNK